jgi:hypothetical protein
MALTHEDLLNVGLPKWPQMYVNGTPVSVEQAKDIIRRTDTFFTDGYGGNNREYDRWVRQTVGMAPSYSDRPFEKYPDDSAPQAEKDAFFAKRKAEADADRVIYEAFQRRWRPLRTSYVHNSWVSCSFIGGPHGWCHPDGEIGFVDNIGKWPSVSEVLKDWQVLAEAFPFLSIGVTLYDGESSEDGTRPLVSLKVLEGKATLVDPAAENVHTPYKRGSRRQGSVGSSVAEFMTSFRDVRREQGLDDSWILEWAEKFGPESK